ncbi:formylglycine-generating enzyme family protein [Devosia sp. A449]
MGDDGSAAKSCCSASRGSGTVTPEPAAVGRGGQSVDAIHFPRATGLVGTNQPIFAADGESPRRAVKLAAFRLEAETVTNARFAAFVAETGYVTEAERFGWAPVFRGLLGPIPPAASPGELSWWVKVEGACWQSPEGPGSNLATRQDHPVVQVSWRDAKAFAEWCGGRLPSEAEWEHAARGGLADPKFPWGDDEPDDQTIHANIWQGQFPHHNTAADGYFGTAPGTAFAPNCQGLYSMIGNVWEWTADPFRIRSASLQARRRNDIATQTQEKTLKGGSFLCHISYCYRYRIAARMALTADSCASNVGFRVAYGVQTATR